jgi:peptide methionine sulfoxide reductase MsrA
MTGHAEVARIVFDAPVVPRETPLELSRRPHGRTTSDARGPDVGPRYPPVIPCDETVEIIHRSGIVLVALRGARQLLIS